MAPRMQPSVRPVGSSRISTRHQSESFNSPTASARMISDVACDPELPPEQLITAGGEIIHELGTARMGPDAGSSVVNSYGQTWDVGNLVLMDGSIFASGAHKNPTLTILALALRASERLAAQMKSGAFA